MFTVITTLIKIFFLGMKIKGYDRWKKRVDKRFEKIVKKSKWLDEKKFKTIMDRSYAKQNIHPEETWDQRAEREYEKSNF